MELFQFEALNKTSGKRSEIEIYDNNGKITISINSNVDSAVISLPEPQRSEFIKRIKELDHED